MCLSPDDYVAVKVFERLLERGVPEARARGVARKVGRAYRERRLSRRQAAAPGEGGIYRRGGEAS